MPEPTHFAVIVARHFIHLREIPMLDPTSPIGANTRDHDDPSDRPLPPSADDHYARACAHLAAAETAGTPIAEIHAFIELANARIAAGRLAVALWPAPADGCRVDDERIEPVVRAARGWWASIDQTKSDAEAELAEAVRALEEGE
jgi:hypothetical protein